VLDAEDGAAMGARLLANCSSRAMASKPIARSTSANF